MNLPYQNAFITGASSGLGFGLSKWFSERGVKVYAAARRKDRLIELQKITRDNPAKVVPVVLDVTELDQTVQCLRNIDMECKGLDLVIANAGVGDAVDGANLDWSAVQHIIEVNVCGAAATLSAVLPLMVSRNRGHLVGMSSLISRHAVAQYSAYCASKAFLSVFLEGLRADLRKTKVKVSCIYPGLIKTEMNASKKLKPPFIVPCDAAVEKIASAIISGKSKYAFPLHHAVAERLSALIPASLQAAITDRIKR